MPIKYSESWNKDHEKHVHANKIVIENIYWAVFIGLVPGPLLDYFLISAIQVKMVNELAYVYQVSFSRRKGRAIISALVGGGISVGGAKLLVALSGGALVQKFSMALTGGATTYALGQLLIRHFEQGGTLFDLKTDEHAVKEEFNRLLKEGKTLTQQQLNKMKNAEY
jgi:uncharacterized protein (DUF697 family)